MSYYSMLGLYVFARVGCYLTLRANATTLRSADKEKGVDFVLLFLAATHLTLLRGESCVIRLARYFDLYLKNLLS